MESQDTEKGLSTGDEVNEQINQDVSNVVDFNNPGDPTDPLNWSYGYKWTLVVLLSLMTLIINIAIPIIAPVIPDILKDVGDENASGIHSTLIFCVWGVGQALGSLILSPFSEIHGRLPVYHASTALFILLSIGGALSVNINMVIAFRFLMGFVTICPSLNPPIVGDLFPVEKRGKAMAMISMAPLLGTAIGPAMGGYLSQSKGWRWSFWIVAILTAGFEVALLAVYRETYRVKILKRKTEKLRKETGNTLLRSKFARLSVTKKQLWTTSIIRPMRMVLLSPIVLLISLYGSLVYGYIYLLAATLTEIYGSVYGFSYGEAGLVYIAIGFGMLVGVLFCGLTMDSYMQAQISRHDGMSEPEYRLMPMILGGIIMPIGLFMYGWGVAKHLPAPVSILGIGIFSFGVAVCQVVSPSYLVDAFGVYAASAVAANLVLRYLASAVLPLAAPAMYADLGYGWGNSLLGFVALAFVPAPVLLMKYGKKVRGAGWFKDKTILE